MAVVTDVAIDVPLVEDVVEILLPVVEDVVEDLGPGEPPVGAPPAPPSTGTNAIPTERPEPGAAATGASTQFDQVSVSDSAARDAAAFEFADQIDSNSTFGRASAGGISTWASVSNPADALQTRRVPSAGLRPLSE